MKQPMVVPGRALHNLSHENKLTMGFGDIVPTLFLDCLPGDSFYIRQEWNSRFIALLAPIMHRIDFYNHYFFVPYRLLWDNFEEFTAPDFLTPQSVRPVPPSLSITLGFLLDQFGDTATNFNNTLLDYFDCLPLTDLINEDGTGLSSDAPYTQHTGALALLAYWRCFNDWYRDENLQQEVFADLSKYDGELNSVIGSNADLKKFISTAKRNQSKDYFTSALPWTQKGSPSFVPFTVQMSPQGVRIVPIGTSIVPAGDYSVQATKSPQTGPWSPLQLVNGTSVGSSLFNILRDNGSTMSGDGQIFINDLRQAFALQRWLERNARCGTRYVEYILGHFGVHSPDARLQRAEWIGGNAQPIPISEVLQTSQSTNDSILGLPAGQALTAGIGSPVRYTCKEHGMLLCLTSLRYRNAYGSGQDRFHRKTDNFDFYTPEFAHLGEQAIYTTELGSPTTGGTGIDLNDQTVFGYQPRYEEYRRKLDRVHGDFRSSLKYWHMSRIFQSGEVPRLNQAFIQAGNSSIVDRIFPVETDAYPDFRQFLAQIYFNIYSSRPVTKYGTPSGLI